MQKNVTHSIHSKTGNDSEISVFVIIPTYNRSHYITAAIDSALNQTFRNLSIFVIDDGSTDETEKVLRQYGNKINLFKQSRGGPGKARNLGLKMALNQCHYIAFLDSDDKWDKSKIETQIQIMELIPDIGFLFSDFCVLKDNGRIIHAGLKNWQKKIFPLDNIFANKRSFSSLCTEKSLFQNDFNIYWGNIYSWLLKAPYVLPSSAIIRHECIKGGIRFPEGIYLYEDWDFFARIARDWQGGFMEVETTFNRGHEDEVRLTRCSTLEAARNRLSLIKRVWKCDRDFMSNNSEMVRCIEGDQLLIMAKEYLLLGDLNKSRQLLTQCVQLKIRRNRIKAFALKIMTFFPWGGDLAILLRNCKRFFLRQQAE